MSRSKSSIVDDELLDWVIREEGFIEKPRNIGDGKITLGSGLTDPKWHRLYRQRGNKWSKEDNRTAVREELEKRKKWAEDTIPNWDSLPEHSQKAMLSYKYNFDFTPKNSLLLFQAMTDGRFIDAMYQMDATSKDSKFKKGLEKRRKREQEWGLTELLEKPKRNSFEGYLKEFPDMVFVNNPYKIGTNNRIPKPVVMPIASDNYVEAVSLPDERPNIDALRAISQIGDIMHFNESMKWENQPQPTHFVSTNQPDFVVHSEGGSLNKKTWDNLSLVEKSEMMRVAIENGITNLSDIKKKYNEFAGGGNIYDGVTEESQKMSRMDREKAWREREKNIAKSIVKNNSSLPNLISAAEHYLNSVPMLMTPPSEVTGVIASEPLLPDLGGTSQFVKASKIARAIEDAAAYKKSQGYKNLIKKAQEESRALGFGDWGEDLFAPVESKVTHTFSKRPMSSPAEYQRLQNNIDIDPIVLGDNLENGIFHEGIHWQNVGRPEYPFKSTEYKEWVNAPNNSLKEFYWFNEFSKMPEFEKFLEREKAEAYITKKVNNALYENARPYLKRRGELQANGLETGKAIGLKPFQEYPGYNAAHDVINPAREYNGYLDDVKAGNETEVKNFWNILTGQYTPVILPFTIGIGAQQYIKSKHDNKGR